MIKFEKVDVWGLEHAVRGMRNPLNSWEKSDTDFSFWKPTIGERDCDLMTRLIRAGAPHRKFLRQIFVSVDITAPLYWWKEFDTYKVGTTANSCSTMHTLHKKEFELGDFSCDYLFNRVVTEDGVLDVDTVGVLEELILNLNGLRRLYLDTKDKIYWKAMVQLLPSSYNQKRTVTMTYENLLNMLEYRRGHKLTEWRKFCEWIDTLPHSFLLHEGLTHEPG
nr:MAG TPA: hypothetical protein [Caudoviricetes sp.]